MKLRLLAASAFSAFSAVAAASDIPSDIEATLTVWQWDNPQIIASTDKAIERFTARYPNVTVVPLFGTPANGWGEYSNAFFNEIAAGNAIDVFATAIEGFEEVAGKGLLLDLDALVEANPAAGAVFDEIEPNLLAGMRSRVSGELNYLPTEWNNIVVYYNKDMFDEAGVAYPADDWTWADFRATAKALTVKDENGNTSRFGFALPAGNFGLQPWLLTNNAGYLDDTWTEVTVTQPEFRESLQFMHDLIHVDGSTAAFEMTGYQDDKLGAGLIAMSTAGHWPANSLRAAGLENLGVANFPRNKSNSTVFGIGGVGVTSVSANPDLAWEFVQELTGEVYQQELADSGVSIPSWRRFAVTEEWTSYPDNSAIFYESAKTAIPVPSPGNFADMESIFMRHLEAYLTNNQDLDTTIDSMNSEMTRSMERASR